MESHGNAPGFVLLGGDQPGYAGWDTFTSSVHCADPHGTGGDVMSYLKQVLSIYLTALTCIQQTAHSHAIHAMLTW